MNTPAESGRQKSGSNGRLSPIARERLIGLARVAVALALLVAAYLALVTGLTAAHPLAENGNPGTFLGLIGYLALFAGALVASPPRKPTRLALAAIGLSALAKVLSAFDL